MKPTLIAALFLSIFLPMTSTAKADSFGISFGYNDRGANHGRHNRDDRYWRDHGRPYYNRGHYTYGYYYGSVYPRTTVIETYEVRKVDPQEKILNNNEKLGISDIIVLSKAGVSDDNIIDKISKTRSVFNLSVEEVEALRREGVSARIINFMLNTNRS